MYEFKHNYLLLINHFPYIFTLIKDIMYIDIPYITTCFSMKKGDSSYRYVGTFFMAIKEPSVRRLYYFGRAEPLSFNGALFPFTIDFPIIRSWSHVLLNAGNFICELFTAFRQCFFAASIIALLVWVAPDTTSTSAELTHQFIK